VKPSIAVVTQAVWSGLSFLTALLLARYLSLEDFGWYAVGLAAKQLALMVLGALILIPVTVLSGSDKFNAQQITDLYKTVFKLMQCASILLLITGWLIGLIFNFPGLAFAVFIAGSLVAELHRKLNYINQNYGRDLAGGLINLVLIIAGLLAMNKFGDLSLTSVFYVFGGVNIIWAMSINRPLWYGLPKRFSAAVLLDLWRIGKWGLGSNTAGYIYSRVSTYYTLLLVGPSGVAVLELGRQMVMVVQTLTQGMANYWQPILARSALNDPLQKFLDMVWRTSINQTAIGVSIMAVMLLALPSVLPILLAGNAEGYVSSIPIAWVLAGAMFCQLLWQHPSFAVIALGKPQFGFLTRLVSAVILLPLGYFLTLNHNVMGAAWSWTLGELIILVITLIMLRKAVKANHDVRTNYAIAPDAGRHAN